MPSVTRLSYTLLASALLILLTTPDSANAISNSFNPAPAAARHAHFGKRMEKRLLPVVPDTQPTPSTTPTSAAANPPADTATTSTSAAAAPPAQTTATASTTTEGGVLPNLIPATTSSTPTTTTASTSALISASTSVSVSASLSTTSATSASVAPSVSAVAAAPVTTPTTTPVAAKTAAKASTLSLTTTAALPTGTSSSSTAGSANSFGKNTIIAIAVIAGSIGGAAAIWTLIRKWKLGPSSRFEERMQPIEWSPEGDGGMADKPIGGMDEKAYGAAAAGVAGIGATRLNRSGSNGSQGSRGSDGQQNLGRNVTGNANMFNEQELGIGLPPPHDFTAGAAAPGAYGAYDNYNAGPGYVDLQRNPSNGAALARQPSNPGAYGLARGPSNVGYAPNAYDAYGQQPQQPYGYENDDAAYAQDAYGGYEAQPAAHQQQYAADPYAAPAADPYAHPANYQGAAQGGRY
ncbi:hypothetical protein FRB96_000385 [Tulasnella sp. 330]|nr:hypothetical protein FRB96_000385 [Tulasnella sp. 330]KAG8885330.1 hypothetical protein FRB97_001405 [Tulasnella sp. 331]KAG8890942.1 hypothetical protein FRB98_002962 [Tulasnella sp. 332]